MAHLYANDLYGEETYSAETESTAAGNGAYNEHLYNDNVYNAAIIVMTLTESISSTDVRAYTDSLTRAEAITLMEVLIKMFNGVILSETITEMDVLTKNALLAKVDLLTMTDLRLNNFLKALVETMTIADVRTMAYTTGKVDAVNLVDFLSKQITNKRVTETVKLNDWFTIKNYPQSDPWS
jgi:hypothetical protein